MHQQLTRPAAQLLPPAGGLFTPKEVLRPWRWIGRREFVSQPVRCIREQWYLVRVKAEPDGAELPPVIVEMMAGVAVLESRALRLRGLHGDGPGADRFDWFETPKSATHLRLRLSGGAVGCSGRIEIHPVAERDPKCHPLAHVPRWSAYAPPLVPERLVVPAGLATLASLVPELTPFIVESPRTFAKLSIATAGSACIVDPRWVEDLGLKLGDLERLAQTALVIIDLPTLAKLLRLSRRGKFETVTHDSAQGLLCARVEYADFPNRGFALQDVLPYGGVSDEPAFRMRALPASRDWKTYAAECGFATLLSSETPWENHHAEVLCAARPCGQGELIATDLPWLVGGVLGRPVAPRLAQHLFRMLVGRPHRDDVQYWNRWDESPVVVRDISDFARRYAPMRPVRWASTSPVFDRLGVSLFDPTDGPPANELLIQTGRMDAREHHDGVPAEPLILFFKWLAREHRERTPWAERFLRGLRITWQFDVYAGRKYSAVYEAASPALAADRTRVLRIRLGDQVEFTPGADSGPSCLTMADEGLMGDGSLEFQAELSDRLRAFIECRAAR